ncbi:MAG: hypothetical protein WEB85_09145 [Dongiaceae bacterium]
MGINLACLLWGFAEATLFFIVPDVPLTTVATWRGRRAALVACAYAVAGAVAGGAVIYVWAAHDQAAVLAALDRIPAIAPGMIEDARNDLARFGLGALPIGAFSGVPYKIYAAVAGADGIEPLRFLAVSIPVRAARFLAAVLAASWIDRRLRRRFSLRARLALLGGFWVLFYAAYFAALPN